jgi:hypothetical protein
VENRNIWDAKRFSKTEDQNDVELVLINSMWYTDTLGICAWRKGSVYWILQTGAGEVNEADFENKVGILSLFLLNDSASAEPALLVKSFLTKHSVVMSHPPCSPGLAPAYIFLFPTMKTTLHGRRSRTSRRL